MGLGVTGLRVRSNGVKGLKRLRGYGIGILGKGHG